MHPYEHMTDDELEAAKQELDAQVADLRARMADIQAEQDARAAAWEAERGRRADAQLPPVPAPQVLDEPGHIASEEQVQL